MALIPPQAFFPHTVMLDVRYRRLLLDGGARGGCYNLGHLLLHSQTFLCWLLLLEDS